MTSTSELKAKLSPLTSRDLQFTLVLVIDIGVFISADSFSAKREKPVEEADRPGREIDSLIFTSRSQSFVLPTQRMARISDLSSDLSMVI